MASGEGSRWAQRWGRAGREPPPLPPSPGAGARRSLCPRLGREGAAVRSRRGRRREGRGRPVRGGGKGRAGPGRAGPVCGAAAGRREPAALVALAGCGCFGRRDWELRRRCRVPGLGPASRRVGEGQRGQNLVPVPGPRFDPACEANVFVTEDAGAANLLSLFEGVATNPISSSSVREISTAKLICRMSKAPWKQECCPESPGGCLPSPGVHRRLKTARKSSPRCMPCGVFATRKLYFTMHRYLAEGEIIAWLAPQNGGEGGGSL